MKEDWINSVMNSADERSKVLPDAQLIESLRRIGESEIVAVHIRKFNWMMMAGVLLLLIINTAIFLKNSTQETTTSIQTEKTIGNTYFDYINSDI